jgi:transcriptional regulator with XRE-family HTH domain
MLSDRNFSAVSNSFQRRAKVRRRAGLTLFDLAQRVGKSPGILSQWERGQISLSRTDIGRIASAFEVELASFPALLSKAQIVDLLSEDSRPDSSQPNEEAHDG